MNLGWLAAPPAAPRRPQEEVDRMYPRLRFQVFMGIFIGYAGFYLVRNNVSLIAPLLFDSNGIDKVGVGIIANAVLFAYGLSKFFSAMISDQSNARYFMPLGLGLSALVNIALGTIPLLSASVGVFALVMFINGWVQGMGWPPAGRVLVHWYSTNERGWKTSLWNTAHNVGGAALPALVGIGLAHYTDQWQVAFWLPGVVALGVALLGLILIRDTPESMGLPTIEEYRDDPAKVETVHDDGLSTWQRIRKHVLTNRTIVMLAVANVFVYALRYGVLNWITVFLHEKHNAEIGSGMVGFAAFELAGILGTILCGFLSDKLFKGYRSGAGMLFTAGTAACIAVYWLLPVGTPMWLLILFVALIGGLIYGPVMLIGLQAIDLSPHNVAGTAAGFTGLFGYLLGATLASSGVGLVVQNFGWNVTFIVFLAFAVATVILFAIVGRDERQLMASHAERAAARQAAGAAAEHDN
ncbi:MFS transporter [Corynebacterium aquilae]|uniref:sn-glycerol-3-phosphate transporter n=1 Tax=Corynebacterium aquilae DSM 44791 TaxID=1431546 RepID=A0A1L7CD91_9CORY|nr:MFS transporter [Corynebacterium aquilae]APT83822.1 sn-glycerol-3-phosphate transporter [Corynebacterium aquilae DSM 44791]